MKLKFWNLLLAAPALLGTSLLLSSSASATLATEVAAQPSATTESAQLEPVADSTQVQALSVAPSAPETIQAQPVLTKVNLVAQSIDRTQLQITPPTPAAAPSNSSFDQLNNYSRGITGNNDNGVSQVTSVSQFSDVQPTDWAFQALQSLVERYGCIAGYPDRTYRGNRALTRYEFAAGLNACLDRVNELIAAGTADLVRKEDLEALKRLQEEFAAELETLRGRVDALEVRTAELEANQFSTTTKLRGEVIFAVTDAFGGASSASGGATADNYNTTFAYRVRLNFDTSFSGTDRLRTRFQVGNIIDPPGGTPATAPSNEARLGFAANTSGAFQLDALEYRFNLNPDTRIWLIGNGRQYNDFVDVVSPLEPSESGAISRFGRFNPIFRTGNDRGAGISFRLGDTLKIEGGYLAGEANDPSTFVAPDGRGLFNGNYSALGQLVFTPSNQIKIGFTYINGYADNGLAGNNTGSIAANLGGKTSYNSYGIQANFRVSDGLQIGGWAGLTEARRIDLGDANIWNYAAYIALPDFGGEGNLAGIVVGVQPRLTGSSGSGVPVSTAFTGPAANNINRRADPDTGFHIEGFYRFALTDNIAITPGVIWLTSPNHDERNNDVIVGTIRTTFTF